MKNDNIDFSVIIPAYNAEKFVTNCLDSVKKQTYSNYEIIVVNDGSKDNTEKVLEEYCNNNQDLKLKVFTIQNGGAAKARAYAIEQASGTYIAFLDADDIWYPTKLEAVSKIYIENPDIDVVYADENQVTLDNKKIPVKCRNITEPYMDDLIINGNALSTSQTVVKKQILDKSNTLKNGKRSAEDIEQWIELAKNGAKFFHLEEFLGEYRRNDNSLTVINPIYTMETNERLISFYDFLDPKKYSTQRISELKKLRIAKNEYELARHFHIKGDFENAKKHYGKSIKNNKGNSLKAIIGYILALFGIIK